MALKKPPLDSESFYRYICDENLFQKARVALITYLKNYANEEEARFKEDLGANLQTVLECYHIEDKAVSLVKNFLVSPPLDQINVTLYLMDEENHYISTYTICYDFNGTELDDYMSS